MTTQEAREIHHGASLILALSHLSDYERCVVVALHFNGRRKRDLAVEMGKSSQNIDATERCALRKLAAELAPLRAELLAA